jgi:hypothetical protein
MKKEESESCVRCTFISSQPSIVISDSSVGESRPSSSRGLDAIKGEHDMKVEQKMIS